MNKQQLLTELQTLMIDRINIKSELIEVQHKLQYIEEIIAKRILDIKTDFNKQIDKNDPKYSNAEKRRVELENVLANDMILENDKKEQQALETSQNQIILKDDIAKIKERYLFRQIDILLSDLKDDINE